MCIGMLRASLRCSGLCQDVARPLIWHTSNMGTLHIFCRDVDLVAVSRGVVRTLVKAVCTTPMNGFAFTSLGIQ